MHRLLAASLGLVLWLQCGSTAMGAVRIAIVETADSYTKATGLATFLQSERVPFQDITGEFRRGELPDLSQFDLLIIGSFITTDAALKTTYLNAADELRDFVARGGVVAVLNQADQNLDVENWLESPRKLSRSDPDAASAFIRQEGHPLLVAGEKIDAAELRNWRVPTTWRNANTIWEGFSEWNEAAVIVANSDSGSPTMAGLIEMGWGKGRAVFYAMAIDKAVTVGNKTSKATGAKLLRNLIAYADLVRAGRAPEIKITPGPGYKHPIQGTVYIDANGNGRRDASEPGRAGIAVSDMFDVVLTDDAGRYRLPNSNGKAVIVFVHQPGDVKQTGQGFYRHLANDAGPDERFNFGLIPAAKSTGESSTETRFVQLTDSHVRNVSDRDYMRQATDEIYAMQPPPDFVVATGDLVDWGVDEHYQNYVAGMQTPPVPYFNVFGNHEIHLGPLERYHQYIGPDYYSFERGDVLYLALNCVTPSDRQDAWLTNTLELLGRGRAVVVFQHFPPTPEQMERFAELGVKSVFSGHWHSEKEMEHAGVQSVNSPTFIMGGIDASPAGFKLVRLARDGSVETEWRYGFQNKRLTIVSPQKKSPVSQNGFPLIVNAYDTSADVNSVTWRLGPKERPVASGQLERDSAISWSALHQSKLAAGSYLLRVVAKDARGEEWSKEQQVETIATAPAKPSPGREWPMFMGDANHTGHTSEAIGKLPLRLAWSVDTGGDLDFASPIFADGRLYLALKKRTRDRTNGVAAFDPQTGKRLWLFETPMAVNHTPAYLDGVLCVSEMGGRIYGIDAKTGRELWHHDLIDNRGRYSYCAPAARNGAFYAGVLRRVAKLRATDGRVEWEERLGDSDNDWISSYGSPAVGNDMIAMGGQFGGGESFVVAREQDGSKIWGHDANGGMLGSPTIVEDRVLFSSKNSTLYCLALADGKELWQKPVGDAEGKGSWSATTPAVKIDGNGEGIVVAGSGAGHMSGFNFADGDVLWTHTSDPSVLKVSPYRRDDRPLLSSPTIAGDLVFFGSADGRLYGLDLKTGEERWSFTIGATIMSTPLVTGNALYVAAYDGRLYAFTSGGLGE